MADTKLPMTFRPVAVAKLPEVTGTGVPKSIDDVANDLKKKVGEKVLLSVHKDHPGDPFVVVDKEQIVQVLQFLRDDERYYCTALQCISAVDYKKPEADKEQGPMPGWDGSTEFIAVVYSLWSYVHRHQINVKVHLDREGPEVSSVVDLYRGANWYERECYDLLGVVFKGHPNLKRILLPPDWVGHPLRRDYVFPEEYNGMKVPL